MSCSPGFRCGSLTGEEGKKEGSRFTIPPPLQCDCSWDEVTHERAQYVYRTFAAKQWSYERLYLGWWQRQIYGHRPGLIKAKRIEYRVKDPAP